MISYGDRTEYGDYKAVINELADNYEHKQTIKAHNRTVKTIKSIPDNRIKMILVGKLYGLSYSEISAGLGISRRRVLQLISPAESPVK